MALIDSSANRAINAISSAQIAALGAKLPGGGDPLGRVKDALVREFGDDAWLWFNAHKEDVIFTINQKAWLFNIRFDVKVKHARKIFVEIAGPDPNPPVQAVP